MFVSKGGAIRTIGAYPRSVAFSRSLLALFVAATFAVPGVARANTGILYGPEDAHVFGDPKADPGGIMGYCVPWSILASAHMGLTWVFSQRGGDRSQVGLDLTMGVRCGRSVGGNPANGGLVIIPQLGYSMEDREPGPNLHFFRYGAAIGFGSSAATIAYLPRVLMGRDEGERIFGIRHGLVAYFGADLFTVELSHQVLFGPGASRPSDLRVGASVNLLVLAYVLAHAN